MAFNRSNSGNSFTNSEGIVLHFRVEWENFVNARCVIFFIPGYGGHINRPELFKLTKQMNQNGAVVIPIDMQGHGYSEGERALMLEHNNLVNDVEQFVSCFMDFNAPNRLKFSEQASSFSCEDLPALRKLPFFLMGSSLGGAISVLASLKFSSEDNKKILPNFKGAILLAPALNFKTPNWILVETLRYTVGTCAPSSLMPTWMSNVSDNSLNFKRPDSLEYTQLDTWGSHPQALGWNHGMRWGTALMFIKLSEALPQLIPTVNFPFCILHDPADAICSIEGSRQLLQHSATSVEDKELIEVPGYLHSLVANEPEEVANYALEWIRKRLST